MRDIRHPMARVVFAAATLAPFCRRRSQVAEAQAAARRGILRSQEWSVEAARAGRSLPGSLFWAILMMACATLRTCRCLRLTDSGATTTYSAGPILRMAALRAQVPRAGGRGAAERRFR